jgi:hypothetical protein
MSTPPNDDGGHADGIFGATSYDAPLPQKREFLPWHLPRKQFVRHFQWCKQIELLLEGMQPDGNTLKYLGLPGSDLLDLRYFHSEICKPRQMKLRFLGFNSGANPASEAQTELNVSLDEVSRLPLIEPGSEVMWDNFSNIANETSIAWIKARDLGPYDVINLDLCDGFGAHEPGVLDNTHYNAVNRLLSLQARSKHPWLLLLTTRVGKQHIHADLLQLLLDKYSRNLINCKPFREASRDTLKISDEAELRTATATPDGLLAVFLVGICKWLLGISVGQQPPTRLEVKSVIGYRVNASMAHDDLISIALRFEPTFIPAADPMGIAKLKAALPSECEMSAKAVKRVSKRRSADALLAVDAKLNTQMIAATAGLLELARYDVAAYHRWLENNKRRKTRR